MWNWAMNHKLCKLSLPLVELNNFHPESYGTNHCSEALVPCYFHFMSHQISAPHLLVSGRDSTQLIKQYCSDIYSELLHKAMCISSPNLCLVLPPSFILAPSDNYICFVLLWLSSPFLFRNQLRDGGCGDCRHSREAARIRKFAGVLGKLGQWSGHGHWRWSKMETR